MNKTTSVSSFLKSQFGHPSGFWGSVAGSIMAHRSSNRERARWTVDLLDIHRRDRVLEIGFGPGVAVDFAAREARGVFVAGIDHSEVMFRQAARRNAPAIREGRVDLRVSSVEDLPVFETPFHKIFSINSIGFWREPVTRLESLHELLVPGGTLLLTVQPRGLGANHAEVERTAERLLDYVSRAGFESVHHNIRPMRGVSAVAVMGTV